MAVGRKSLSRPLQGAATCLIQWQDPKAIAHLLWKLHDDSGNFAMIITNVVTNSRDKKLNLWLYSQLDYNHHGGAHYWHSDCNRREYIPSWVGYGREYG